ncbi:MAG: deoxynucleoside kinase [Sedimentisphaerales bacterium]|nr:deoxynucleoside kinase [Sedimentisphaerales bacterium]
MPDSGLIAIAGIIGVGKTTLAQNLSPMLDGELVLEEYDQNPFLALQIAGDRQAGLASELFFLLSRARQLNPYNLNGTRPAVCDYIFQKNRIFAARYLDEHQFAIYDEVESAVKTQIVSPRTVIYLKDSVENCLSRIARRGRDYEKPITADWLKKLDHDYESLFQSWDICPVIRVDCHSWDLRQLEYVYKIVQKL